MERLGGPDTHGRRSGLVHVVTDTDEEAFARTARGRRAAGGAGPVRAAVDVRPGRPAASCCRRTPSGPTTCTRSSPGSWTTDPGFEELHAKWAPNVVTALGRLAGRTVGVVANNPLRLGGCLDSASAEKAARFVRMCDAFGVPLVVLVDVPGYLPGVGQEWDGVVRRGAKLLHAFAEAVVPRVTLVTAQVLRRRLHRDELPRARRDRGVRLAGRRGGRDGRASAAVGILHRKKLAAAPPGEREALHAELAAEHERVAGGVNRALSIGVVDEIDRARAPPGAGWPRPWQPHPRAGARTATSRSDRPHPSPQPPVDWPLLTGVGGVSTPVSGQSTG